MPDQPQLPMMQVHFNIPFREGMINVSVAEAEALRDTLNEYLEEFKRQNAPENQAPPLKRRVKSKSKRSRS